MDRRYLKNVGIYILTVILSILLIAYIIYHLVNSFSSEVETIAADVVTVSESYACDAYIFRNEKVLYSDTVGTVTLKYEDGTKVSVNSAVADIHSGTNTEEINDRVSLLDKRLSILENSNAAQDTLISDSTSIDNQIDNLFYTVQSKLVSGDLDYVFRRKDELLTLLNKRQLILKAVDSFDGQIAELKSEKNRLKASLGGSAQTVTTDVSGYLYSEVDGYEDIFTGDSVNNLTLEDFHIKTETNPVQGGTNAVAKIATDFKWYVGCEVPTSHQQYYTEGMSYTLNFPYSGGVGIPMNLYRIVASAKSDTILLIFSTGYVPRDFNYLRKQSVEIIQQSYTGYRVPVSAVRIVDGKQGVYIKSGNVALFKEINPMVEIDGYLIVEEQDKLEDKNYADKLGMYDLVITKGKNLYDNKIIE